MSAVCTAQTPVGEQASILQVPKLPSCRARLWLEHGSHLENTYELQTPPCCACRGPDHRDAGGKEGGRAPGPRPVLCIQVQTPSQCSQLMPDVEGEPISCPSLLPGGFVLMSHVAVEASPPLSPSDVWRPHPHYAAICTLG